MRSVIEASGFRGHDPFDLVNAPLLQRLPRNWVLPQLALSRFGSRLAPDGLRRLLRVPAIEDPKIYVCSYFAYDLLGERALAQEMLSRLTGLAHEAQDAGRFWGYDYLWATRQGVNPRNASTLVPGAFAMLALADGILTGNAPEHADVLRGAVRHYGAHHLSEGAGGAYLAYFAGASANTHNANALGCAALTVAGIALGEPAGARVAARAIGSTLASVRADGYLAYTDQRAGDWADGFHHLYVVAALRLLAWANPFVDAVELAAAVERLESYWSRHFARADGHVNYFPDRLKPIDPHNHAAAALYCVLTGDHGGSSQARTLLRRLDDRAWDARRQRYAHRVHRLRTDRRQFLRWTYAWMFAALAASVTPDPLRERRVTYTRARDALQW